MSSISRTMHPDRRAGMLLAAAALLLFAAIGGGVVLPAADASLDDTTEAHRELGELEADGLGVFRSQGCWYCHTQQVRDADPDALGEPLAAGDHAAVGPAMLGAERIGPDLTHVGSRRSADELREILSSSRGSMPSYGRLPERELDALVAYLLALR